jgi:uncharacterized protein YfcZ (UPF0381/DUF406 family)
MRLEEILMCPACMATVAMMVGSVVSTGGLTALVVKVFHSKNESEQVLKRSIAKEKAS